MSEPLTRYDHAGFRFDVLDAGPRDGPVVIALHGFPQTATSWRHVSPRLTAYGRRVLAPDQRGYSSGARPQSVSGYRLDTLAGDVLALADAAGADRFDVLGHDWGGAVAWYLASRHADRIRTATIASTPHPRAWRAALPHGQALRSWYMGLFQLPRLPEWLLRAGGGTVARRMLAGMDTPDQDAVLSLLSDPATARATLNWYRAAFRPGAPGPGRVPVPTTFVWSDRDPALGRYAAEATAGWVDGDYRFVVLTGVSHWIPEERPEDLARLALDRMTS